MEIDSDTEGFAVEVDLLLLRQITPRIGETNVVGVGIERDMVQEGVDGYGIVVASLEIHDSNFASPWVEVIVLILRPWRSTLTARIECFWAEQQCCPDTFTMRTEVVIRLHVCKRA